MRAANVEMMPVSGYGKEVARELNRNSALYPPSFWYMQEWAVLVNDTIIAYCQTREAAGETVKQIARWIMGV